MTLKKREFTPESGSVDTYAVRRVEGISKIIVSMEKLVVMVSFQNNIEQPFYNEDNSKVLNLADAKRYSTTLKPTNPMNFVQAAKSSRRP